MSTRVSEHIQKLKSQIKEVTAKEASETKFDLTIDVRESAEANNGIIPGAIHVPRGFLELKIEELSPDRSAHILLYCGGGNRSLLAADNLLALGYKNTTSLKGGIKEWKDSGLKIQPSNKVEKNQNDRYQVQMRLPVVGEVGQQKIRSSKILIVGVGGLGSPIAYYLAAAGVGNIGIIDDDVVDISNLHRQILHSNERLGMPKVDSAWMTMKNLNPDVNVVRYNSRLTIENVDQIVPHYDLIIDGCDNFQTRYLVNDACLKHKKINVHGSVVWMEGQVTIYCHTNGPCYRCLYPEPPSNDIAMNCAEAGVLGVLPGTVGLLQATEALKLILSTGRSLVERLILFDAAEMEFTEMKIKKDPNCPACSNPEKINYQTFDEICATKD